MHRRPFRLLPSVVEALTIPASHHLCKNPEQGAVRDLSCDIGSLLPIRCAYEFCGQKFIVVGSDGGVAWEYQWCLSVAGGLASYLGDDVPLVGPWYVPCTEYQVAKARPPVSMGVMATADSFYQHTTLTMDDLVDSCKSLPTITNTLNREGAFM